MFVVGLLSTWQEGQLAVGAARSLLAACDTVLAWEAPVAGGPEPDADLWTDWKALQKAHPRVFVVSHDDPFDSDAAKRSRMLDQARGLAKGRPFWCVVVDGDELLIWGEHLRDMIAYHEATTGGAPGGFNLRLTELDGSCSTASSRCYRGDAINRYILSSHIMETVQGVEISLPHIVLRLAGEPDLAEQTLNGVQRRRPVPGEPHIHHRSLLRDPSRRARRLHEVEREDLDRMGFDRRTEQPAPSGGVPIWLPK